MKNLPRFVLLFVLSALGAFGTIQSQNARISYTLTTLPSTLPVTFPFNRTSGTPDLIVLDGGTTNTTNSPPVTLTYNSDYTVSGGGYNSQNQLQSGNVTVLSTGTHAVQTGHVITILRNVPLTQTTVFSANGVFNPLMIEAGLDKLTTETQQLNNIQNGTLRFQPNEVLSGVLPIASRIGDGSGTILGFDTAGNVKFYPSSLNITPISSGVVNQLPTGFQFANQGAKVNRFNDRILLGGATANDGDTPPSNLDWLSAFQVSVGVSAGAPNYAALVSETGTNANSSVGIIGASRSLNSTSAGTSTIGIEAYALNNNATLSTNAWAYYGEAHRTSGTVGSVYGMELDTRSTVATITPTPYAQGNVVGLQLASGAGLSAFGQVDASSAISIQANPKKFKTGILFGATSITGTDGVTGSGPAIVMAKGHSQLWYNAAGNQTSAIIGDVATANLSTRLQFNDNGASVTDYQGNPITVTVGSTTPIADYLFFQGGTSGSNAVTLAAGGTDANISINLVPKGSGVVTGSFSGNAATATKLATARNINGVAFDGTADITVTAAAGTLTGSALPSGITSAPGLTTVSAGTIGTMAIQNANSVAITGGSVTGLPSPSASSDAATKAYVDGIASGIVVRTACLVATTANITLSGAQTIDGVAVVATNRVLVKNQTTTSENGIYAAAAGAWSRSTDSDTAGELLVGYTYFVSSGTTQASTSWSITTAPTTINSDPVLFTQFSGSQTYAAGTGLTLTGNTFSVNAAQPGITSLGTLTGLTVNGTVAGTGFTNYFASPPAIGGTVRNTGAFTTGGYSSTQSNGAGGTGSTALALNLNGGSGSSGGAYVQFLRNSVSQGSLGTESAIIGNASNDNAWFAGSNNIKFYAGGAGQVGAFTSTGFQGVIGGTTPAAGTFTTISSNSNANLRTTKGNLNLTVNVKDYGAVGDGSTDDTSAINSAITALVSHGTLFFPSGKYRITAGVTAFSSLSYITITGTGAEIYNDSGSTGANTFVVNTTCTHFDIYGLRFTGTASVRGSGIHIRMGANNSSIHDNYFQGCSDFAVLISANSGGWLTGASFTNNIVEGSLGDGVHVGLAVDVVIANNRFESTGDDSIGVVADDTTYVPQRVSITGNLIYNAGTTSGSGIRIAEGIDITCNDNSVYTSKESAIRVTRYLSTTNFNTRIHIVGNKVYNAVTSAGPRGAIWVEYADQVSIMSNQVIDPGNGAGIAFLDCNDITIKGNFLRKCPSRSIATDDSTTANVRTSWTQVYITDNDIDWTVANEAIYVVPASGITLTNLMITGNTAHIVGGNWIYYARTTTGRVGNNTNTSGATISNGGSVSGVTLFNNN